MPRIAKPLTDTQIKGAVSKAKKCSTPQELSDGSGLKLRISTKGTASWLFNYHRPYSNKRNNIGIGAYPNVSLKEAREFRTEYKTLLAKAIDPQEHRVEQNAKETEAHGNTLESIAEKWLEIKKGSVSKDHANDIWRSLELHIFPDLGNKPIHKLKAQATIKIIQPIASKGSLETVKRLCQRLNEIMVYATNSGIVEHNPLAGISKAFAPPKKQHQPTIKPEQLPDLMKAISRASIKITTRNLIEWQLHTMVRPSEAAGATWDEIDTDNNLWNIPAERMKKKKAHSVPLTKETLELLEEMKPISGNREYIFPSDRAPRKHANPSTANVALKRMGYGGVLVAHGLRALASTTLNEQGFDADVIEAALSHVGKDDVRTAYNRAEYLERRRKLMEWWSERIDQAAKGIVLSSKGHKALRIINE